MANSKANIYPIQLQNAELNLNKYDAEIKQYTGFNKNNAPFVGGCLSNIFSKDAVIEGSTYIDTDGTIYKVDSEGFYQNDNKLVSYNPNVKFYNKRKIGNGDYVKFISEKIYITIERAFITESPYEAGSTGTEYWGNAFVAHWGDGYKRTMCSSQEGLGSIMGINVGIEKKDGVITFSVKRTKNVSSNLRDLSYLLIVPDEDSDEYYYYTPGFYFTKDTLLWYNII